MAVLFVAYIPCEDDTLEELVGSPSLDETDKGRELADGLVNGVEKDKGRKDVLVDGGRSCATLPRIQVNEGDPGGGEPGGEQDVLKDGSKDHLLRGAQSTP